MTTTYTRIRDWGARAFLSWLITEVWYGTPAVLDAALEATAQRQTITKRVCRTGSAVQGVRLALTLAGSLAPFGLLLSGHTSWPVGLSCAVLCATLVLGRPLALRYLHPSAHIQQRITALWEATFVATLADLPAERASSDAVRPWLEPWLETQRTGVEEFYALAGGNQHSVRDVCEAAQLLAA